MTTSRQIGRRMQEERGAAEAAVDKGFRNLPSWAPCSATVLGYVSH